MERVPDAPRQRALLKLSRYPSTPGTLVVELDADGNWRVVSEDADRSDTHTIAKRQRDAADRDAILAALERGAQLTRTDLEDVTGAPARQWHATLDALIKDGCVAKLGAGRKGDPYRYEKVRADAQRPAQDGAESNGEMIPFSAHPRRGAEKESSSAPFPLSAHGAESGKSLPRCTCADGGVQDENDIRCHRCWGAMSR
jgi:hypothetical protein